MAAELLDIQPRELKFTVEVKKQSSCSIQLRNKSDQYVAFKVKTTSPKKYCVRPNLGVIQPRETCDFTVIMQGPRTAPTDLQCKDKFLVQSTVIAFGTVEEDLTPETFARDGSKFIEDKKLRVVLVSAPSSPVSHPVKKGLNSDPSYETSAQKDRLLSGQENTSSRAKVMEDNEGRETVNDIDKFGASQDIAKSRAPNDAEGIENVKDMDKSRVAIDTKRFENAKGMDAFRALENIDELKVAKNLDELRAKNVDRGSTEKVDEVKPAIDSEKSKLVEEFKTLKSKHSLTDTKLREAELTIKKLIEERSTAVQEKDKAKHELETLKKGKMKTVQVGFPTLYVVMVALVSVVVGYAIHS